MIHTTIYLTAECDSCRERSNISQATLGAQLKHLRAAGWWTDGKLSYCNKCLNIYRKVKDGIPWLGDAGAELRDGERPSEDYCHG